MAKYLYGASVQGIQSFIFQTDELRDIIGASELVRKICTETFKECLGSSYKEGNSIIAAAGNVKYIFDKKEDCEKAVLDFPRKVMSAAPGVTISQAVVECSEDGQRFGAEIDELESKLRTQRNRQSNSMTLGSIGIQRSRTTGLPAVKFSQGVRIDEPTYKKRDEQEHAKDRLCNDAFGESIQSSRFPYDLADICGSNNWIAIIHADGNGLGQVVREIGRDRDKFRNFSLNLDEATKSAARLAFNDNKGRWNPSAVIPIRPVVIGGDDFTVICRGDFAVQFAESFLRHFEEKTEEKCGRKLTACAGIAFVKSSYPFHYGYDLAETLCEEAKKDAKQLDSQNAPSCLMFHKVQDSFMTSWSDLEKRELTPISGISYKFGPYYLEEHTGKASVKYLFDYIERLSGRAGIPAKEASALKSRIREWLTVLSTNGGEAANQLRNRGIKYLGTHCPPAGDLLSGLLPEVHLHGKTIAYDLLAICSIMNKVTKRKTDINHE